MREVGPSRKILHARGVGSERRKRVAGRDGSWGAFGATRKFKFSLSFELIRPLQRPLFWAPRMRFTSIISIFNVFKKCSKVALYQWYTNILVRQKYLLEAQNGRPLINYFISLIKYFKSFEGGGGPPGRYFTQGVRGRNAGKVKCGLTVPGSP